MPDREMTIEAAIIELNRLKAQERMEIDRDRLTAAVCLHQSDNKMAIYWFAAAVFNAAVTFLKSSARRRTA